METVSVRSRIARFTGIVMSLTTHAVLNEVSLGLVGPRGVSREGERDVYAPPDMSE